MAFIVYVEAMRSHRLLFIRKQNKNIVFRCAVLIVFCLPATTHHKTKGRGWVGALTDTIKLICFMNVCLACCAYICNLCRRRKCYVGAIFQKFKLSNVLGVCLVYLFHLIPCHLMTQNHNLFKFK